MSSGDELFDVAPFVLVIDRSDSMKGVIDVVNRFVPQAIETMRQIPEALESAALGVVAFNEQARVMRRITWMDEEPTTPHVSPGGRTSYVKPLEATLELIEEDVPKLGERGLRPIVFFVTDAQPNVETEETWMAARSRLLDSRFKPKLVTFGFGSVDEATLRKLASRPDLAELSHKDAIDAINEILNVVTSAVITLTGTGSDMRTGSLASRIIASESGEDQPTVVYRKS